MFFLFAASIPANAARVDTVITFSRAMNKNIPAAVITPESYKKGDKRYPVVYLLHGYGSNFASWLNAIPELKDYADSFNIMLVCSDANIGSWYFDSPVDPAWKYDTYTSKELVSWIDMHYRTIANRKGRGVTGFSMGGHGALYLAFKHQDVYGAAGSMSGGVDFRPFPRNWDIAKRLGTYEEAPSRWDQYTVTNMIGLLKPGTLSLIIDCGTDDFFFAVNNAFHEKLIAAKIPHDYIVRPGKHDWLYWKNSINYQLLFMSRYFSGL
jgi:S-formylglutathione hydrolase FrmB